MLDAPTEPASEGGDAEPWTLGPYRIDGVLGRGGMGEVLRGWDPALRRPVAIKRILGGRQASADARARFWREARALAALDHPGIVRVHRVDETPEGELYLAMELIEGSPLSASLPAAWPSALVAAVGHQTARALGAAHAADITHRDVKPSNLLIQPDGVVRVVDFGLARGTAPEDQVTATGNRVGTPAYMAPEQIDGEPVGPPADIFALGTVLYQLLSGVHPFARESPSATAMAVVASARRPLAEAAPMAPEALVEVIERCLARDPAERPADGAALAAALAPCGVADPQALADFVHDVAAPREHGTPVAPSVSSATDPARHPWWWALAAVVLVGGAAWWGWSGGPEPRPPAPVASEAPPEIPARPVVAVLGFAAPDDDPDDPRAAIAADAARYALSFADDIISAPHAALAGLVPPDQPVGPQIPLAALTRPNGGVGHVDLVVSGALRDVDGAPQATVSLTATDGGREIAHWTVSGPHGPIEIGEAVARGIAGTLGVTLPPIPPPARSTAAYGAYLAARHALRTGDFGAFEHNLEWALQLDPKFVDAELLRFEKLRGFRQLEALATAADALRQRPELSPRQADLARAWAALGHGKPAIALRALNKLVAREPYAVDGYELLLALRFNSGELVDLGEAEAIAERILTIAPRHEGAASRLVRALAWRGRGEEAARRLSALGVARDDPGFREIWGELDLYLGRYDQSLTHFAAALERSPDNLYAEHMRLAALILSGACERAALDALDRIQRIEAEGQNQNLDWTYSLASQALICRRQWPALEALLVRWAERSPAGRDQAMALRPRAALAAGVEAEAVAEAIGDALPGASAEVRPLLLRTLARVSEDPAALKRHAAEAEIAALAAGSPTLRRTWSRTKGALALRARALADPAEALPGYADLVFPPAAVRHEGDLIERSELLAIRAEAQAAAGDEKGAAASWAELASLGYPRLYTTDAWVLAQAGGR